MIDDSRNDIFLLFDKRSNLINYTWHANFSALYVLDPINIYWGSYSQVEAELLLLKSAINTSHYSFYHLMSGQDLPLVNPDKMHNFFNNNLNKEFLQYQVVEKKEINQKLNNHLFINNFDSGIHSEHDHRNYVFKLFFSLYRHVETLLLRNIKETKIPINKVSIASTWMSISDDLARTIVKSSQWIYSKFHRGENTDEIFIPTLINYHSSILDKVNITKRYEKVPCNPLSNLMYIEKDAKSAHPKTFNRNDYKRLVDARKDGYLFARKFDSNFDDKIITKIYNDVMNS